MGYDGVVYEKHTRLPEVDHRAKLIERATAARALPAAEKERLLATRKQHAATAGLTELPVEVQTDKQVLRVFAWTQESVPESRDEAWRVRRVVLLCYLEDQTIAVFEPREDNAGLPQGTMIKRHRIPKRRYDPSRDAAPEWAGDATGLSTSARASAVGGGAGSSLATARGGASGNVLAAMTGTGDDYLYYDWSDLWIGNDVTFYGRTFRIYDADGFTRRWFLARGIDQGPADELPMDPVRERTAAALATGTLQGRSVPGAYYGKRMHPVKEHMEAMRGRTVIPGAARAQFLKHDGELLRFDVAWRQPGAEDADLEHYCLTYFLADDTVEVREFARANSGKDAFPTLLKRGPLPIDWRATSGMDTDTIRRSPELFVRPQHLRVGSTINVFGRVMELRACDPYTRAWYERTPGQQPQAEAHWEAPAQGTAAAVVVPPHTGFGDEEDALQNCRTLEPRPPRKDYNKWMMHDGKVFRWRARLAGPVSAEDVPRRFTISFYPADDSVAVFEPAQGDLGLPGGKVLLRGRHKNENGRVFDPRVFVPGSTVRIMARAYEIVDADPYTRTELPEIDEPALEVYFMAQPRPESPGVQRRAAAHSQAAAEAALQEKEAAARAEREAMIAQARQRARAQADARLATRTATSTFAGTAQMPAMYRTTASSYGAPLG